MSKQFLVSSEVQATLLTEVLIPQMKTGFWRDHRPAGHGYKWDDVKIVVSNDTLGAVDFKVPRLYNFVNPQFIEQNLDALVNSAKSIKANSTARSVKKELIELSRIAGGRIVSKTSEITKANRGTNKTTATVNAAKSTLAEAGQLVKRTAVKKKVQQTGEVVETVGDATVRRVAVQKLSETV